MSEYHNENEIEDVVRGFELCTTDKHSFRHSHHLTVAAWYLNRLTEDETLTKMREGLHRFIAHHSIDSGKYNETITLFWIKIVHAFMRDTRSESLIDTVNAVVREFTDSRLVFEYYSEELVNSASAKTGWVEPDLKLLES